ncbi:MAG: hypothetical protein JXA67_17960 [Micromonosporaceae bacterium]|nr:hypothetical protein [Micromonosporaceae bacterium]
MPFPDRLLAALAAVGEREALSPGELADVIWLAGHLDQRWVASDAGGDAPLSTPQAPALPLPPDSEVASDSPASRSPDGPSSPSSGQVKVFAAQPAPTGDGLPASYVRVPASSALGQRLQLDRALRPLKPRPQGRRRSSTRGTTLDEHETATRLADTGIAMLAFRPDETRHRKLVLVADTSASMLVWRPTVVELTAMMRRHGAFRTVRLWTVDTDGSGLDGPVHLVAESGHRTHPRELHDPTGTTVVLVVTDGIGRLWRTGAMEALLRQWGQAGPTALVSPLPHQLWHRTSLRAEPVWCRSHHRHAGLDITSRSDEEPIPDHGPGTWIPVLELTPDWITDWAAALAGTVPTRHPATARFVPTKAGAPPERDLGPAGRQPALSSREQARAFRASASPMAFRLATYLAAVPLSLPVMYLVQHAMLPESRPVHLAEVYLSGLLVRRGGGRLPPRIDDECFEFLPGVRAELLRALPRTEARRTLRVLGAAPASIAQRFGGTLDFRALVPADGPGGPATIPAQAQPFAEVAALVLRGLGGHHAQLADRLIAASRVSTQRGTAQPSASQASTPQPDTPQSSTSADPEPATPPPDSGAPDSDTFGSSAPSSSALEGQAGGLAGFLRRTRAAVNRGPAPLPAATGDPLSRFAGVCPVCGGPLGNATVAQDPARDGRFVVPPPLRVEIGPPVARARLGNGRQGLRHPHRVTILPGNYPPGTSRDPVFREHEIDQAYLLCGNGHLFPDPTPLSQPAAWDIDEFAVFSAVGAPACGKTYLLTRLLSQLPSDGRAWLGDDERCMHIRRIEQNHLEDLPLRSRQDMYEQTRTSGSTIAPTGSHPETPHDILHAAYPEVLDTILMLVARTTADPKGWKQSWGTIAPQPPAIRTEINGTRAWTGIADLPGELFAPAMATPRELRPLRGMNGVIWVVDPVLAPDAPDWLDPHERSTVLAGSLRPSAARPEGSEEARLGRARIQRDIGDRLTRPGNPLLSPEGPSLRAIIAVTKCDLIHAALLDGRQLTTLGREGAARQGAVRFLARTAQRWSHSMIEADSPSVRLLEYLHAAGSNASRRRCEQVADGLLRCYSRPAAFWNLVNGGAAEHLRIDGDGTRALRRMDLDLPAISDHSTASLDPEHVGELLFRDMIMSTVGSGMLYAIGLDSAMHKILRCEWIRPSVYLCSALGSVPVAQPDGRIRPRAGGPRFPEAGQQSAALTQLLLAVLEGARIHGANRGPYRTPQE